MILLLVIVAWILVLSLIMGVCAVARTGDLVQPERASAPTTRATTEPRPWERLEHQEVAVGAQLCSAQPPEGVPLESSAPLLRRGGIAA